MANLSISPGELSRVDIKQLHELGAEKVWLPDAHARTAEPHFSDCPICARRSSRTSYPG